MSHVMGVGILGIGLNRTDLGCWRLTLIGLNLLKFANQKNSKIDLLCTMQISTNVTP